MNKMPKEPNWLLNLIFFLFIFIPLVTVSDIITTDNNNKKKTILDLNKSDLW